MKKNFLLTLMIFLAASCFFAAETKKEGNMTYKQISQEDAKKIMDSRNDIIILDVRTLEEYNSGHIKGAICVPVETISSEPKELPDKGQTILVYCRSGNRSKIASQKLADLGYTDIREFGGIVTWKYMTEK